MSRKVLVAVVMASTVILALTVLIVVRKGPAPAQPASNIGSIRDLTPVALPATAPETQPPKSDAAGDVAREPTPE